MFQASVPHFNSEFTSHRTRLPDKEYGEALDCIVKGCSDMLLLSPDANSVLLGKRIVHPQPDWWFVGGRIFPGETPTQSCCRLLKRELSLDVEPARLRSVCCASLAWGRREQPPQEHGTTDIQIALTLQLTSDEVDRVRLDPAEYSDSKFVPLRDIEGGDYHPALKFAVGSLIAYQKHQLLRDAVEAGHDDASVAAIAREFIALQPTAPQGESQYRIRAPRLGYEAGVVVSN